MYEQHVNAKRHTQFYYLYRFNKRIQIWLNKIQIQLKRNGMQIDVKYIENLIATMVLKDNLKKTNMKRHIFTPFVVGNMLNIL